MSAVEKVDLASVHLKRCDFPGNRMDCSIQEIFVADDRELVTGIFEGRTGDFTWKYPAHEMVYVLEGEYRLEDIKTGEVVQAKQGEVIHITKGAELRVSLIQAPFRCLYCAHNNIPTTAE